MATDKKRISTYFDDEVAERLRKIAVAEQRTVSSLVAKIITDWLDKRDTFKD